MVERTIHDEPEGAIPMGLAAGQWYVLNFVLSDMHGAYMPVVQSGPHAEYDDAYRQGLEDNVRYEATESLTGADAVTGARAFSIQNLTAKEVARFRQREQWLLEPMLVPLKDANGHVVMRSQERPYA